MNIGVVIIMYNEHDIVLNNIKILRECTKNRYHIVIVHSDDNTDPIDIKNNCDMYYKLPNLYKDYHKYEFGSRAQCRNYSKGFSYLYKTNIDFDFIVAMFGDTLITRPTNFDDRFLEMKANNKLASASQAIGQRFHAINDDPINNAMCSRLQIQGISDIMPQLFILDGKFAIDNKWFSDIEVTNKWTTEQCMGDEIMKKIKNNFSEKVLILNSNNIYYAYSYDDGVQLQYKK